MSKRNELSVVKSPKMFPVTIPIIQTPDDPGIIKMPQLGTILRKLESIEALIKGQRIVDEKLKFAEAADYLKISESSLYKLVKNKEIKCYRVGGNTEESGNYRFRRSALDKWIEKQEGNE